MNDTLRRYSDWHKNRMFIDARRVFLEAVFYTVPQAKTELIGIMATNRKVEHADAERTLHWHRMLLTPLGTRALKNKEQGTDAEREQALDRWMARWKLTAPWCRERAQNVIFVPWDRSSLQTTFTFECPGWDSLRVPGKLAEVRIREQFEIALRDHLAAMALLAIQEGRLDPAKNRNAAHFLWTARYQSGGEEYADIALTAGVTSTGVGHEVRKVLRLIGLTPRRPASKGGRPAKIKPQS